MTGTCSRGHDLAVHGTQRYKNGKRDGRRCKACREYESVSKYGLSSFKERETILKEQGGKCAICDTTDAAWGQGFMRTWHIDHAHNGKPNYRGILCSECNLTLGRLKDDLKLIYKFVDYLERNT